MFFHKNVFLLGADYFTLVLEYADSGTLNDYLKKHFNKLNWNDKFRLAHQLANALESLHDSGIIHCDLVIIIFYGYLVYRNNTYSILKKILF